MLLLISLLTISCNHLNIYNQTDWHYHYGNVVCKNRDCCWVKGNTLFCSRGDDKEFYIYIKILEK